MNREERKRQARSLVETRREQVKSSVSWTCLCLHFNSTKAVTAGRWWCRSPVTAVTQALESASQISKTALLQAAQKLWVVHHGPSDITVSSHPEKRYMFHVTCSVKNRSQKISKHLCECSHHEKK